MTTQDKIFKKITDSIIEGLENDNVVAWRKPWKAGNMRSLATKQPYQGMNAMTTNFAADEEKNTSQFWVTYAECKKRGGQVLPGAKGVPIVFWGQAVKKDKDDETKTTSFPLFRYSHVFNLAQTTLPQEDVSKLDFTPLLEAEGLIAKYKDRPPVKHMEPRAFYNTKQDFVNMPKKESFDSEAGYYATLFHELSHSTGHAKRLNRKGISEPHKFGDALYSKEELIAEMGAAFLCGMTGIDNTLENSKAYIKGWLEALRNDPNMVKDASRMASKAVKFITDGKVAVTS